VIEEAWGGGRGTCQLLNFQGLPKLLVEKLLLLNVTTKYK
jgi:hypothetical protein